LPRDVVEMDRWVEVAKRRRREIAAAVAAFIKEAFRGGGVGAFGPRGPARLPPTGAPGAPPGGGAPPPPAALRGAARHDAGGLV